MKKYEKLLAEDRIGNYYEFKCYHWIKNDADASFHTHDYYELILIPYNSIIHCINGEEQYLDPGTLIFIRPNDCHNFKSVTQDAVHMLYLGFTEKVAKELFNYLSAGFPSDKLLNSQMPSYIVLTPEQLQKAVSSYNVLITLPFESIVMQNTYCRITLFKFFSEFFSARQAIDNAGDLAPEWLKDIHHQMKRIENFSVGFDQMLKLANCSKEHLCRSMKKYYGVTPVEFITNTRLSYICNMLIMSDKPIIEISYESGFTNLSWMYSLFKKKYSVTPMQFRKNHLLITK